MAWGPLELHAHARLFDVIDVCAAEDLAAAGGGLRLADQRTTPATRDIHVEARQVELEHHRRADGEDVLRGDEDTARRDVGRDAGVEVVVAAGVIASLRW